MNETAYDVITLCLEQKNIFMKDVFNMTKRIEVESKQEEVILDELLSSRQNRLERIKKCNNLIETTTKDLDDADRIHIEELLDGNPNSVQNENESYMLELISSISDYMSRTAVTEEAAKQNLSKKRDEARMEIAKINAERSKTEI